MTGESYMIHSCQEYAFNILCATFLSVCTDICLAKCRLVCVQPSKKPAGHSYEAVEGLLVEKKTLGWLRVCVL